MGSFWTSHRFACAAAIALTCALPAYSQKSASPPGSTAGAPSGPTGNPGSLGTTTGGRGSLTNGSTGTYGSTTGLPDNSRAIFLSGRVMFDDGTPTNSEIRIERVCSGNSPHLEAHTDSKGHFYFQLGSSAMLDTDAADSSLGSPVARSNSNSATSGGPNNSGLNSTALFGCDLRASYPGYRSDMLSLASHRALDEPDLGTIVLHRLGDVKGSTVSMTTALAPKRALKAYEKGLQLMQKGKSEEAEKYFSQATDEYPKYALAWFALGELQQGTNRAAQAQKSYEAAIAADPKYVSPYDRLAYLFGQQTKWQESADYSSQALDLNPVEFPSSYWYNAVANYNLKRPDKAEKSARGVLKLDSSHRYPEAERLLASLLLEKGEYSEAAAHLRAYLVLVPTGENSEALKQELAKLEQESAQAKK